MTAREVPAAAREEYGGRWSWLFVLGLAIERAGRTFTTWTVEP